MIARCAWLLAVVAACGGDDTVPVIDASMVDAPLGPDPEGRIARYLLDDDFADGVRAEVGAHGRCHRCPDLVAGRTGGAAEFDGSGEIIVAPSLAMGGATAVTADAWVRIAAVPPEFACIVGKRLDEQYRNAWQICTTKDLELLVCTDNAAAASRCATTGPGTLIVGQWQHVAITSDGAMMRAFVGALEVTSAAYVLTLSDGDVSIGADIDYGAPGAFFTGTIDDVRVWNRALTPAEIAVEVAR